jgi:4-hydroxy-2-oxoglutarate aldolase
LKIYQDYQESRTADALALQHTLAKAEWELTKAGINGTKWTVARLLGYPEAKCAMRKLYPRFIDTALQSKILSIVEPFMAQEEALGRK